MPPLSISEDKERILTQLRVNFQNLPDEQHEVAALLPQLRAQARGIIELLSPEDFRPAEVMALMSLVGPVLSRTPLGVPKSKRRTLRVV